MLYSEYMFKAKDLVVTVDEYTNIAYLEPDYRIMLIEEGQTPDVISDYKVDWQDVREVLDLEAHKRNAERNNSNAVIDWIYDTITSVIEPTTAEQQNELIQNVMNYMELNASLKSKERDLEKKEKTLEEKDTIVQMMPGLNFSKR